LRIEQLVVVTIAAILLSSPLLLATSASAVTSCSVTIQKENTTNNAIQMAILNAEAGVTGKTICVASGTYPEQLTITSSGIQLLGLGTSKNPTIIEPPSSTLTINSFDPDHSSSVAAIIAVDGRASPSPGISGDVISNIVVDGVLASPAFKGCSTAFFGVYYRDASGSIKGSTAQNIYLPSGLNGCQTGLAIIVLTDSGYMSSVLIGNDKALNYQKNGITCRDSGTSCIIQGNKVSFYSPAAPYIAPNGIEVSFGALAKVTGNIASGNICTLSVYCGSDLINQAQGTGILTYESAAGTLVSGNTLKGNDLGIGSYLDSGALTVKSNIVKSSTFAGIVQYDGDYTASKNTLASNPIGVAVVSDGFGPYPATGSSNTISHINGNTISGQVHSVEIQTVSPGTATVTYNGVSHYYSGTAIDYIH
jgi:hypothetical protein